MYFWYNLWSCWYFRSVLTSQPNKRFQTSIELSVCVQVLQEFHHWLAVGLPPPRVAGEIEKTLALLLIWVQRRERLKSRFLRLCLWVDIVLFIVPFFRAAAVLCLQHNSILQAQFGGESWVSETKHNVVSGSKSATWKEIHIKPKELHRRMRRRLLSQVSPPRAG